MIKDIGQKFGKIFGFIVGSILFTTVYLALIVFFFTFNPLKTRASDDLITFPDGTNPAYYQTLIYSVINDTGETVNYHCELQGNSLMVFYYGDDGSLKSISSDNSYYDIQLYYDVDGHKGSGTGWSDYYMSKYDTTGYTWSGYYTADNYFSSSDNVLIFDTVDHARNYIDTGDTSGWVNKPGIDWTIPHDFSRDKYSAEIPIPQVSNLGLTGFTLLNRGDYYYDVIVESRLYGVKVGFVKSPNGLGVHRQMAVDKDWVYATNYYNFELDDKAHNATHCSIVREYGISLTDDLVEDYKNWSAEYPNPQSLPSYEWYIANSLDALYKAGHTCNEELGDDLGLIESGQSEVTYYIRYMDTHGNYGQWVRYKWSPNVTNDGGTLVAGSVEVSPDGNVIVNDVLSGTTDEHGSASYTPPHVTEPGDNDATISEGITQLTSILSNMKSFLGGVPDLVAYVFPFLPWWLTALIFGGIGLSVLVAIIHTLRG